MFLNLIWAAGLAVGLGVASALSLPAFAQSPIAQNPAPGGVAVDLELVLAVDVSGSIDQEEALLQREGYLAALTSPEVIRAATSGALGKIAIAYVEWAGEGYIRTVADWHLVEDEATVARFAREVAVSPIVGGRRTSISGVVDYALPMFDDNGFAGTRRIIDISGDGPNNSGVPVLDARARAIAAGVGINGLAILNDGPGPLGYPSLDDLDIYYEECVIAGPGAFVLVAEGLRDFGNAIRRKLVLEIADLMPDRQPGPNRGSGFTPATGYDCMVGERQLRDWLLNNPFEP
jgi:hypothetical protein